MTPGSPKAERPKRAPTRTCIGCRRRAGQDELVRIVLRRDGTVRASRTLPGRGAWLCAGSAACLEQAIKRKALSRALRAEVDTQAVHVSGWDGLFD